MKSSMKKFVSMALVLVFSISVFAAFPKEAKAYGEVFMIDPGHGGNDPGALSMDGTRHEADDTLNLSLRVGEIIAEQSSVAYTRTTDKTLSLNDRCVIANNNGASYFISIHRNAFSDPNANGLETYYSKYYSANSVRADMAQRVQDRVMAAVPEFTNRRVKTAYFTVLTGTAMHSILIETGFITNERDNQLFDDNFDAIAYAIADGMLSMIGKSAAKDEEAPKASSVSFSDITDTSYTINLDVSDNFRVTSVKCPTWSEIDGQDDIVWYDATIENNKASVTIDTTKHGGKTDTYHTHIYVYDAAGNEAKVEISANGGGGKTLVPVIHTTSPDIASPVFTNVEIKNLSARGYTVECTVSDASGIDRVQFPTWTDANGQDDLAADWGNNTAVRGTSLGNGKYSFDVSTKDHNGEGGIYITHIYAYDKAGNYGIAHIDGFEVPADTQNPTISDITFTNITANGYRINIKVSDNGYIDRVEFPTWSDTDGQDDLVWHPAVDAGNGNYYFDMTTAAHGGAYDKYITHIYAFDKAGNIKARGVEAVGGAGTVLEVTLLPEEGEEPKEELTPKADVAVKVESNIVLGLSAELTLDNVKDFFEDSDSLEANTENFIGTGTVLTYNSVEYTVVILGDTDGNGQVNSTDYLQIKGAFVGTFALEGVFFEAANCDDDAKLSSTDYIQIKGHFLGNFSLYE